MPLFEKGAEIAQRRLETDPENFQARRDVAMANKKLAQALAQAGQGSDSLEKMNISIGQFQQLVELDPNNTETYYDVANTRHSVGTTLFSLKRYSDALSVFKTADREYEDVIKRNPQNIYPVRMRSINYEFIGNCNYEIAKTASNKAEYLKNALEGYRFALKGFLALEESGNLNEYDRPAMEKISKLITDLEKKVN